MPKWRLSYHRHPNSVKSQRCKNLQCEFIMWMWIYYIFIHCGTFSSRIDVIKNNSKNSISKKKSCLMTVIELKSILNYLTDWWNSFGIDLFLWYSNHLFIGGIKLNIKIWFQFRKEHCILIYDGMWFDQRGHIAWRPPSTGSWAAVIKLAFSLARNAIVSATSTTLPGRPRACVVFECSRNLAYSLSFKPPRLWMSVTITPYDKVKISFRYDIFIYM